MPAAVPARLGLGGAKLRVSTCRFSPPLSLSFLEPLRTASPNFRDLESRWVGGRHQPPVPWLLSLVSTRSRAEEEGAGEVEVVVEVEVEVVSGAEAQGKGDRGPRRPGACEWAERDGDANGSGAKR